MTITINNESRTLDAGATVSDAVAAYSPYGADPVIVLHNGARVEPDDASPLSEGDALELFPLLIGG